MPRVRDIDKPDPRQLEINWTRGTRRTWIERLILPAFTYTDASGNVKTRRTARMKTLLRIVEGHARDGGPCYLKAETIAKQMGASNRTVFRAIADCVEAGLLDVEGSRYKGSSSRYEIQWFAVKEVLLNHPETIGLVAPSEAERSKRDDAATCDTMTVTCDRMENTCDTMAATCDKVTKSQVRVTSIRVRAVLNHDGNHVRKPLMKPCTERDEQSAFGGLGGWPIKIETRHLQSRETVQYLFEHARACNYVTEADRERFFRLARYTARMAGIGEVKNAGAYFTAQLREKNWLGDHKDRQAAIDAILQLDGRQRQAGSSHQELELWRDELAKRFPALSGKPP